jgi:hypothetical protein
MYTNNRLSDGGLVRAARRLGASQKAIVLSSAKERRPVGVIIPYDSCPILSQLSNNLMRSRARNRLKKDFFPKTAVYNFDKSQNNSVSKINEIFELFDLAVIAEENSKPIGVLIPIDTFNLLAFQSNRRDRMLSK